MTERTTLPCQKIARIVSLRDRQSSLHLDLARGIAAIAVLAYHIRYRFFLDYADLPTPKSLLTTMAYVATSFGHDAVIVFFVLSGFFISRSVIGDVAAARWTWGRYALHRFVRLYLVLVPGLLLTILWDQIGTRAFEHNPIYTGAPRPWINDYFNVAERSSWTALVGNLAMVQAIRVPPYGSNDALWSLSFEFWYYALFPCLYLSLKGGRRKRAALLLAAACIAAIVGKQVLLYFPIWLMGTALCLAPRLASLRDSAWRPAMVLASGCFFGALTVLGHLDSIQSYFGRSVVATDYLTAAGFATFLYVLLHSDRPARPGLYERTSRRLSGFSYSLYLTHLPLLVFLRAWLIPDKPWEPSPVTFLYGLALAVVCLIYALIVAELTEERTDIVRRKLVSLFRQASAKSEALESQLS